MGQKYSKMHGSVEPYNNFRLWYDPDPDTIDNDIYYPLPYSNFYFRRFVELFFSRGSERDISYHLDQEFIGDEIDSDYIEELLIKAKDLGFFAPRAQIIFLGETISFYPPLPLGRQHVFSKDELLSDKHHLLETYEGSKANKDRGKLIRKWLNRRADRIAAINQFEANKPTLQNNAIQLPILTPATVRTLYLKLLEHPTFSNELTAYQKSELLTYAESERLEATRLAVGLMDTNPQYSYPLTYQNGHEVEYWQEKNVSYSDSQRVLRLLADAAPTNRQMPPTPDAGAVALAVASPQAASPAEAPASGPAPNAAMPPPAEPTEAPDGSPDPPVLSSADIILGKGFTLETADKLARAVNLIDECGRYRLDKRKLGAVVGLALALQQSGKLVGAIPALTAVLGQRWGVQVATRKTGTGIAEQYFKLTNKVLARLEKTD